MCDSLGQSDQKIKVFRFSMLGQSIIFKNIDELIENIKCDAENWDIGEKEEMSIEVTEMYEHEIENLPEFTGY